MMSSSPLVDGGWLLLRKITIQGHGRWAAAFAAVLLGQTALRFEKLIHDWLTFFARF
jgi:hypothetical protein